MARDAGIDMSECRLLQEGGRRHFMTRRFDRHSEGSKLHMQSLAALAHFDFNTAGVYAYEQAFDVIKRLELPMRCVEQLGGVGDCLVDDGVARRESVAGQQKEVARVATDGTFVTRLTVQRGWNRQ